MKCINAPGNAKGYRAYFLPIFDIKYAEYENNVEGITDYINQEAERIHNKGSKLILVDCIDFKCNRNRKIMLIREHVSADKFKLGNGIFHIRVQYKNIIRVMKSESTKVIKEWT